MGNSGKESFFSWLHSLCGLVMVLLLGSWAPGCSSYPEDSTAPSSSSVPSSNPDKSGKPESGRSLQELPSEGDALDNTDLMVLRARQWYREGHYLKALPLVIQLLDIYQHRQVSPMKQAEAHQLLGNILFRLARFDQAKAHFLMALNIRKREEGRPADLVVESLSRVGHMQYLQGDYQNSESHLRECLNIQEREFKQSHPDRAVILAHIGVVRAKVGDFESAQTLLEQAIQIMEASPESIPEDYAFVLNARGGLYMQTGDLTKAREYFERGLFVREQTYGSVHPLVAKNVNVLAELLLKMGEGPQAELFANRALAIRQNFLESDNPEIGGSLYVLSRIYSQRGQLEKARYLLVQAYEIQKKKLGNSNPLVSAYLVDLGHLMNRIGDRRKAKTHVREAIQRYEDSLGTNNLPLAYALSSLGLFEAQDEQYSEAEPLLERALSIRRELLGPTHPDVGASQANLARLYHAQGDLEGARILYEQARQNFLEFGRLNEELSEQNFIQVWDAHKRTLDNYAYLLNTKIQNMAVANPAYESLVSDAFRVSEQARSGATHKAVGQVMMRLAARKTGEFLMVQALREGQKRRDALWSRIGALYGGSYQHQNVTELGELKNELLAVQKTLSRQVQELEEQLPRYRDMVLPNPMTVQAVQSLLDPGEALISFYALPDAMQVWLIKPGSTSRYWEIPVKKERLGQLVRRIRQTIQPTWQEQKQELQFPPFDREAAHELYNLLFTAVEGDLTDLSRLILIPDDILFSLPFGVLIQDLPDERSETVRQGIKGEEVKDLNPFTSYMRTSWLAKAFPMTILPSASALRLLRMEEFMLRDATASIEPFIGFGDPHLSGHGEGRGGAMPAERGARVNTSMIQGLSRLPGTRKELLALAMALQVEPATHLFLGSQASESQVNQLHDEGRLGSTRVLAFATHGLLAGEISGLTQPALVLTPPEHPTEKDDGLLSMEEVLEFRMPHTELVVLSACNTAGGDGSGQGLSGLARAFFYAGAKSLLVSHWSVEDRATQFLMTEVFKTYAHSKLSPSQALQQGILAMMKKAEKPGFEYFAHPFAWAPFFVIGDGGRSSRH